MSELRLLLGFGAATALVFWGTPVAIRVAARLNFYDQPTGYKGHVAPTPYLGGAPVVIAFMAVLAMLTDDWERTLPVTAGVLGLWALGTLDDRRTVSPGMRVAVESAFATLLYFAGVGWELGTAPAIELAMTVVWVVAVVNALNLFDNMDGAASSIVLVISAGVVAAGVLAGDAWLAIAAAGLCGACVGFLPHNLARPARIFLGDGGSMPLGFAVAALVMLAARGSDPSWQALALGVLLVGVPALDTCLVMVSRRRRGVSILTAGRDHLTHRTFRRLPTTRAVAFALGSVQALLATLGLVASRQSSALLLVAVLVYLVGAATAIVLLDRERAQAQSGPATASAHGTARGRPPALGPDLALLAALGLGAGLSPFVDGFYAQTVWAPIGLGLLVLLTAVAIARPAPLARAAVIALAGATALGLLAILSSAWADSATSAVVAGNRYVAYAAFLALVLLLVRDSRGAATLVGAFAVGALAVACADLGRMLGGDLDQLFVGGRLNGPLGYINGQGSFLVLAAWPCLALAEQRRFRWLAGLALGAATLLLGLSFMAQSRGVVLAAALSIAAVVALAPGRRRRGVALALVAAGIGAAAPDLVDTFDSAQATGAVAPGAAFDAARTLALASIGVGLAWWGALAAERAIRSRGGLTLRRFKAGLTAAFAVVALGVVAVSLLGAGRIERTLDRQYSAFIHLDPTQGGDSSTGRLASGGGNRYDYWRVAVNTWADHPVGGVGGGNYPQPYYRTRSTTEAILQPHSLQLQTLAELGAIGGLLLIVIAAAVATGIAAQSRRAGTSGVEHGLLVACTGMLTAWGVHTSVDWMHLIPGVTAAALVAAAAVMRARPRTEATAWPRRDIRPRRTALLACACAIAVALAAASLSRQVLADWFRSKAESALARSPADAVKWADRSLRLDSDAPATYYVKAAAVARFGDARGAEQILHTAIAREPGNFLTYALLGDVYVRDGRIADAKRAYAAALARNPREPALIELARDPTLAEPPKNR